MQSYGHTKIYSQIWWFQDCIGLGGERVYEIKVNLPSINLSLSKASTMTAPFVETFNLANYYYLRQTQLFSSW